MHVSNMHWTTAKQLHSTSTMVTSEKPHTHSLTRP